MTDLAVIVFAFDEAENVGPVLRELCDWLDRNEPDHEILFVDDGSRDDTAGVARRILEGRRAQVLRHERNRGIGAALKTGVRHASARWVTFMPADGQIEPAAIGTLRAAAAADPPEQVEVVFSVYDHRNDGLDRTLLSAGVRLLIAAVHQVAIASDGPYLFRRTLFDPEQLAPDTFFLNFEFPIRVASAGLPCRTVTIHCRPRRAGVSKSASLRRILGVGRDLFELRWRRFHE
ncbi:MAG TPA: glycosyltransferase family 2 protein [Polyangiales bacterium]|nr:glycosyltransferase family 2 protein [Polyangiales bacterium]